MNKFLALLFVASAVSAQTVTPNIQLTLPPYAAPNWNSTVNGNFSLIDTAFGIMQVPYAGAWAGTTVYNRGQQVTYLGILYTSLVNSNFNNIPLSSTFTWQAFPISGGSGCTVSGSAFAVQFANSVPNGCQGDPSIQINPNTHSLIAGSGPLGGAGVIDTTNGLPVQPRLLLASGIGGGTDVCALFAKQSQLDNAAGYIGRLYHDNLPSGSATQSCSLNTLWDPALNQAMATMNSARRTVLSSGVYRFPGLALPGLTTLEGQQIWGSTSTTGTQIQPLTSGNNMLASVASASGGALTVTNGQTCTLTGFNDGLANASVTVTFAATNSWAGATFSIVQAGYGATASPTSATLTSGTGMCSGSPTLTTTLAPNDWMPAYSYQSWIALVNYGPSSPTGAQAVLAPYLRNLTINCQFLQNSLAIINGLAQQGSGADHLSIDECNLGIKTDNLGPSGGSQNRAPWRDILITLSATSTSPVASQVAVMSGGSGYTHASAVFAGCSLAPVYDPTIVGGVITAWTPDSNTVSPFGQCPNGTGVTVAVTGDGSGATADATIEMLLPTEGMYFTSGAGGGTTSEVSIVGGAASIKPYDAIHDEAGSQEMESIYGESVGAIARINETNTAGIAGDFFHGLRGSSANNWMDALFENGGAGPAGFTLVGALGSAGYAIMDKSLAGNQVPCMAASFSIGGNGCAVSLYSRDISGGVVSNLLGVPTTVAIGQIVPNATSAPPQFFMPVKNVGGYATLMTAADAAPPWGVSESGSEAASHTAFSNVVVTGWVPCYFVNTPVPGDYWSISTTSSQCSDTGSTSASPPTSGWTGGIVAQDGAAGSVAALTTQVVTGVTSSVTQPSTNDVQYKVVARTATDQTTSAASTAIDVTNGPQGIGGASSVSLLTIPVPATFNYAVYRTVLGRSALPSITAVCNTTLGTYTRLTITGTMTGIWFPPTVSFSGGTGTNPAVTLYAASGQVQGGTFTNHGSGCTGNLTGSVTASTCEIGFLKFNGSSTTFKDNGICARPDQSGSTTPPASALIGPRVTVNPQPFYGPSAGSSGVANLVPDTGFKQGNGGYWNLPAGVAIVANGDTNPNSAANAIVYTGTGSPSGIIFASAGPVNLVSGQQYSFSSWVDTTNITAGSVLIRLCNTPTCGSVQYAALGPITGATALTQRALFTASATVAAFYVIEFNLTATNATPISIAEPQVARSTNLLTYVTNDGPGQGDPASGIKSAIAPQFSALAAGTGHVCIHADTAGNLSPTTGSDCGSGGSMTWPAGGAGIPNYSGSSAWGTSYSASNQIPANFIPTLNQNTTGQANTALALAASPTNCPGGQAPTGINASGTAQNCTAITSSANAIIETGSWSPVCGVVYRANAATGITATLPASITTGCNIGIQNVNAGAVTITSGGPTYTGVATVPNGYTVYFYTDGTAYYSTAPTLTYTGLSFTPGATGDGLALNPQYMKWACETGVGDGLNAMPAGTYLQAFCYNTTGVTVALTGLKCFTDNSGSSTMNAAGNTLGALLTGAVSCTTSFAAGTQSANVLLTNGDYIKFTFVADGTSKQATWVVTGTY